ncbi:uncharacterized protein LOC109491248 isoform X2 [Ailuropoda melanoleuca]|uniref:uncharacterized protein LOC109491248 isoform X2 n=1 Tax=Ailuropoda melanoleuca TaxID=9646 RepID=UPI001494037D|nr:uncharacterized protein LOC109491248 isoform X2 [Ailuropoda melanoleuca]
MSGPGKRMQPPNGETVPEKGANTGDRRARDSGSWHCDNTWIVRWLKQEVYAAFPTGVVSPMSQPPTGSWAQRALLAGTLAGPAPSPAPPEKPGPPSSRMRNQDSERGSSRSNLRSNWDGVRPVPSRTPASVLSCLTSPLAERWAHLSCSLDTAPCMWRGLRHQHCCTRDLGSNPAPTRTNSVPFGIQAGTSDPLLFPFLPWYLLSLRAAGPERSTLAGFRRPVVSARMPFSNSGRCGYPFSRQVCPSPRSLTEGSGLHAWALPEGSGKEEGRGRKGEKIPSSACKQKICQSHLLGSVCKCLLALLEEHRIIWCK